MSSESQGEFYSRFDAFMTKFDLIDKVLGVVPLALSFVPYRRSHKGRKVGPYIVDPGLWPIHLARGKGWCGGDLDRFLIARHVAPGQPRLVTGNEFILHVKRRQARWAEYLMARARAPFGPNHVWFDRRNIKWAAQWGYEVPMWGNDQPTTPEVFITSETAPEEFQRLWYGVQPGQSRGKR